MDLLCRRKRERHQARALRGKQVVTGGRLRVSKARESMSSRQGTISTSGVHSRRMRWRRSQSPKGAQSMSGTAFRCPQFDRKGCSGARAARECQTGDCRLSGQRHRRAADLWVAAYECAVMFAESVPDRRRATAEDGERFPQSKSTARQVSCRRRRLQDESASADRDAEESLGHGDQLVSGRTPDDDATEGLERKPRSA